MEGRVHLQPLGTPSAGFAPFKLATFTLPAGLQHIAWQQQEKDCTTLSPFRDIFSVRQQAAKALSTLTSNGQAITSF